MPSAPCKKHHYVFGNRTDNRVALSNQEPCQHGILASFPYFGILFDKKHALLTPKIMGTLHPIFTNRSFNRLPLTLKKR